MVRDLVNIMKDVGQDRVWCVKCLGIERSLYDIERTA